MKIKSELNTNSSSLFYILTMPIPLSDLTKNILGMFLFTSLVTLGAFVRIYLPFTPVPITLQTLFVLLAGAFLGYKWGVSSMVLYLGIGALGAPVFAGASGGILYLFGPTGGYLAGFVFATWIVGFIIGSNDNPSYKLILTSFLLATSVIYFLGIYQLIIWTGYSFTKALSVGLIPFIPGDMIKILMALTIIKSKKKLLKSKK